MKKWKTPLLLILLLMLQTAVLWSESEAELQQSLENDYGINLSEFYSGQSVLTLLLAIETEAEESIEEAYNSGYKAASLILAPESEYWKSTAKSYEERLSSFRLPFWSIPVTAVLSFGFAAILFSWVR